MQTWMDFRALPKGMILQKSAKKNNWETERSVFSENECTHKKANHLNMSDFFMILLAKPAGRGMKPFFQSTF